MADKKEKDGEKYTGPFRKPRFDLYAMLLLLSLLVISLAITVLYLEQERFGFKFGGGGKNVSWAAPIGPANAA